MSACFYRGVILLQRVGAAPMDANHTGEIVTLSDTAKTAVEAAQALGIKVGQVASSIGFGLPGDPDPTPLLVITSGRHRLDAHLVADFLDVEKLLRADADFVRQWSGFAIGDVSPLAWLQPATIIIRGIHLTVVGPRPGRDHRQAKRGGYR